MTGFGSRSLGLHLLRGALGFGALFAMVALYPVLGWPALLLLGVTLWMLRGCPICWTIGLIETVAFKVLARREAQP